MKVMLRGDDQYHLEPETALDHMLLETLDAREFLDGMGRDVATWDIEHAQVSRDIPAELKWIKTKLAGKHIGTAHLLASALRITLCRQNQIKTADISRRRLNIIVDDAGQITEVLSFG